MKKVLHVSNYYPPNRGGIEQVCSDIVYSLKGKYEQVVICFNHEKSDKDEIIDGTRIIRVGYSVKISSQAIAFSYNKQLKKLINEYKPDIIHFHYPNPFVSHYLLKIIKKMNVRLILHWHLDITKQKFLKIFFEGQTNKLLQKADVVLATSPNYVLGSPYLTKYKDKVKVIPLPINEEKMSLTDEDIKIGNELREKYGNKIVGLYFGRHVEHKGLRKLILASKKLDDQFKFLIGSGGPLTDEMKKLAKDDPKVEFIGKVSDSEYRQYLYASDIFVFPSLTKAEAFGIALAEGLSYGKPAITYTIEGSGVNYVSLKDVTGLEVENGSVDALAMALNKLKNEELRKQLGENARKRVEENFKFESFKQRIIEVYDENSD